MHSVLLPLFPLQLVLFPGTPLPLHIFEERYKEMIAEILSRKSEFGVVQAGEKGILNTGCTASIEHVIKEYPDGKLDILTMGRRRFEIVLLNEEKSYLRAEVQFFEDEDLDQAPEQLRVLAIAGFNRLREVEEAQVLGTPNPDDPQLSFKLAQLVPDLSFRQVLLNVRSETQRLKQFIEYLPAHVARKRRVSHVQKVAPLNGHAHTSVDES